MSFIAHVNILDPGADHDPYTSETKFMCHICRSYLPKAERLQWAGVSPSSAPANMTCIRCGEAVMWIPPISKHYCVGTLGCIPPDDCIVRRFWTAREARESLQEEDPSGRFGYKAFDVHLRKAIE